MSATESRLWSVGTLSCIRPSCPAALFSSADGGRRWRHEPLPPSVTIGTGDLRAGGGITHVLFANDRDGWLYGPDLWSTHDSGHSWLRLHVSSSVVKAAVSDSHVWLIAQMCRAGAHSCRDRVLDAIIGSDRFGDVRLPGSPHHSGAPPDVATDGRQVAVLDNRTPNTTDDSDLLDLSLDDGQTWTQRPAPCLNELGGSVALATATVWAACPSGMQSAVDVSRAGSTFVPARGPWQALPNSASVYANGTRSIVATVGRAYLSNDGGHSWRLTRLSRHPWQYVSDIVFATASVGYALVTAPSQAWVVRTPDAGRTWSALPTTPA